MNPRKCELFWPSGDQLFHEFNESILRLYVSLLGSPLWGIEHFTVKALNVLIDKVKGLQTLILELDDPQVELHLLRSCFNVCKINHLLQTVPSEIILNKLGKFDENVRSTLAGIIHSPIPDDAWSQAVLSFSYRGLGLREATKTVPAAFTASCTIVRSLVVELLPNLPTGVYFIAQNKAVLPD